MMQQNTDLETCTRIEVLREHSHCEPEAPVIGPRGQLKYRGRTICLSERNALLAGVLIYHFGSELTDVELLDRVWPEGATHRTLCLQLRRLGRRVARIGLTICDSGYRSYALRPVEPIAPERLKVLK